MKKFVYFLTFIIIIGISFCDSPKGAAENRDVVLIAQNSRNIACMATVTTGASSSEDLVVQNCVDRTINPWDTEPYQLIENLWVQFDFMEIYTFSEVYIDPSEAAYYATAWVVEISLDGETWENVYQGGKITDISVRMAFDSISGRYLRIRVESVKNNLNVFGIREIAVFGELVSATEKEEPAQVLNEEKQIDADSQADLPENNEDNTDDIVLSEGDVSEEEIKKVGIINLDVTIEDATDLVKTVEFEAINVESACIAIAMFYGEDGEILGVYFCEVKDDGKYIININNTFTDHQIEVRLLNSWNDMKLVV